LFEINSYKKRFDANKVELVENGFPYIVRTSLNNGLKGYILENEEYLNEGNTISFGQDTATMFYQEKPYFTGDKIKILKPKFCQLNKITAHFFISTMAKSFSSFSWGSSSFNVEIIKKQKITLPILNGAIDFAFMEDFIAELEVQRIAELEAYLLTTGLNNYTLTEAEKAALQKFEKGNVEFEEFRIVDLFEKIKVNNLKYKTNELPSQAKDKFVLPALTAGIINQGLNNFVPKENATILKNVISISANGANTGVTFYQPKEFTVLQDAYAIKFKERELIANVNLFLTAVISKTIYGNYEWTNKAGWERIKTNKISLPTTDGKIDYSFMAFFISAVQKLVIADVVRYADRKIVATRAVVEK
jgi:hypothetical protein